MAKGSAEKTKKSGEELPPFKDDTFFLQFNMAQEPPQKTLKSQERSTLHFNVIYDK